MKNEKQNRKQQKQKDYKERYLRALADYQNLEKRIIREKKDFVRYTNFEFIKKLLPILDNFELAQKHIKDEGIKLIYKQLWEILRSQGLEKIKIKGEKFDPNKMECIEVVKDKNKDKEEIKEIRPGYKLKGKTIRVAQVKVLK